MTDRPNSAPRDVNWALLVIDMQNGFCHPDGSFAQMISGTNMNLDLLRAAIPRCHALIDFARAQSRPVIYTRYVYQAGYRDQDVLLRKYPKMIELGSLAEGSWDAAIIDQLTPEPFDFVIDKSRYSAFYSTRLESLLTGMAVRSLAMCGVTTNICVESTARDAAQRGYDVSVIADATGEFTAVRHHNALEILEYGFSEVLSSDQFMKLHSRAVN